MSGTHETVEVSEARWREAQAFEQGCWDEGNQRNGLLKLGKRLLRAAARPRDLARIVRFGDWYCGDDWNYWWLDAFEGYRALPRHLPRALEVGCGPYSNIRLIRSAVRFDEVTCSDPLMSRYLGYRRTWVATQARRGRIRTAECPGEALPFEDGLFDLVVCINVLDHVRSLPDCIREMRRVLKPRGEGWFVLGQELTDARDYAVEGVADDVGHPIKLERATLEAQLSGRFEPVFDRVLPRERGRNPRAHCGTRLLIARTSTES
jgi:SAM-dependent methyltransferase